MLSFCITFNLMIFYKLVIYIQIYRSLSNIIYCFKYFASKSRNNNYFELINIIYYNDKFTLIETYF